MIMFGILAKIPTTFKPILSTLEALWCRGPELNWGHADFQSAALPTELPRPETIVSAGKMSVKTPSPVSQPPDLIY